MKHTGEREKRESHDRGLPESLLVPEDPGEGVRGEEGYKQRQSISTMLKSRNTFVKMATIEQGQNKMRMKDNVFRKGLIIDINDIGIYYINCMG